MGHYRTSINLGITTGDIDGIGLEVTLKALNKIKLYSDTQLYLHLNRNVPRFLLPLLNSAKKSLKQQLCLEYKNSSPALWVEEVAKKCVSQEYNGMITAPLSKTEIKKSGMKDMGHTGILSRVSGRSNLHMAFLGSKFHTLLATAHIPIREIATSLTEESLQSAILNSDILRQVIPQKKQNLPLALVGLNPHAGEHGLIGKEEVDIFKRVKSWSTRNKISMVGPLSPDSAFQKSNWPKYSVYVSCYHDQGLIPFKVVHGHDGVHLTMGLPFIRTSVDHGTAKDIFSKNIANPKSMSAAIKFAEKLAFLKLKSGEQ